MTEYLKTNGARIAYDVNGSGEPVLLVHAGVANRSMWDDQVVALRDAYRVIRHDTRGFGETETEAVPFSNRADIADLLGHLGERSGHLVGLSRGGQIALDFALEFPDRVRSLTVVAGGVGGYESPAELPMETWEAVEAMEEARDWQALTDWETAFWADGPGQSPDRVPDVRRRVHDWVLANYRAEKVEGQPEPLDPPAETRLADLRGPLLVMLGTLDDPGTVDSMRHLAASVPGARLEEFESAHMVNLEHPERFNRMLRAFLDGILRGVTEAATTAAPEEAEGNPRLGYLLAAAMFVLVVDTSLMNVSISAVVEDLGTTVSGVQSAIALEALVSAAFILISSKIGDLFGRKRAFIMGLLGYAIGAAAMVLANGIVPVIIFWAVIGGLGASLLLPSMQSLIHGNFEGAAQRRVYALVGAAAAIAAAIGPLVGGFITTFLSWRVGFALEIVVIAVVLGGMGMVKDVVYTGSRSIDLAGALLSVLGMGGIVLGVLVWQEGGEAVGLLIAIGVASLATLAWWLQKRKREGKPVLIDPILFASKIFRLGITGQMMQQIALGGMMIALPIFLQMVLEYNALQAGLSLAPLSLSMFFVAIAAGRRAGNRRPAVIIRWGFLLLVIGIASLLPFVPRVDSGWWLAIPLAIAGSGLGLLVSQLNNYTLGPIEEERISEAAGVNSAGGSFGLSFGLAVAGAVMLATLAFSFTNLAESSEVFSPEEAQQVAKALDEDAQLMSNTGLEEAIVGQPPDVEAEIIRINTEARPIALQVALLVPLIAGLIGLFNSFRMIRLPDVKPKADLEGYSLG